jgi:hypothetical protein
MLVLLPLCRLFHPSRVLGLVEVATYVAAMFCVQHLCAFAVLNASMRCVTHLCDIDVEQFA